MSFLPLIWICLLSIYVLMLVYCISLFLIIVRLFLRRLCFKCWGDVIALILSKKWVRLIQQPALLKCEKLNSYNFQSVCFQCEVYWTFVWQNLRVIGHWKTPKRVLEYGFFCKINRFWSFRLIFLHLSTSWKFGHFIFSLIDHLIDMHKKKKTRRFFFYVFMSIFILLPITYPLKNVVV